MRGKSAWCAIVPRRKLRARTRIDLDQRSEEENTMHPVLAEYEVQAFASHRRRMTSELGRHQFAPVTALEVPASTSRKVPAGTAGHAMSRVSWFFTRASHGFQGSAR
jgi:hypothetical protein